MQSNASWKPGGRLIIDRVVLSVAAGVEFVVGLSLIIAPQAVAFLIFGTELQGLGLVLARIGGIALLSLGVACAPDLFQLRRPPALTAMFLCNAMLALYLGVLSVSTIYLGWLFWPALLLHGLLAILLGREWYRNIADSRHA